MKQDIFRGEKPVKIVATWNMHVYILIGYNWLGLLK